MHTNTSPELDYAALLQRYHDLQQQHSALQVELRQVARSHVYQSAERNLTLLSQTQKQEKAATLQRVFYEIAERASAGLSFFAFLQVVHQLLGKLLYAKNCIVCLHDVEAGMKHYPYFVDERDTDCTERLNVPRRRGMTEFVLETGQAQIMDSERFAQLRAAGEMPEATGDMSFTAWLGVPMRVGGELKGVLVVQAYEPGIRYEAEDADVLTYVASHVGNAIERVRVLEELRKSEERYRTVIENVGVGVAVFKHKQLVFANQKVVEIVGYPMEHLQRNAYTAITRPQDLGIQIERRTASAQEGTMETSYRLHLVTKQGIPRDLEMTTVPLDWEGQRATLMFVVDVTAREAAERVQNAAVRKQVELAAMQSRFITMASHEYRTPLTTIHGSVELLQHYQDRMSPEKKQEILQKIGSAVRRMTHMLDKVLVIGRSDAGEMQFNPKPLAIAPLCMLLLDELRSAMADACASRDWVIDLPESPQPHLLDEVLIRHIVGNLLSNAVKYSHPGGKVELTVRAVDGQLELSVADDGIGIPPESQDHLFDRFHRADNVGAIAGTGLGLAIVKEAVQCHGGSIAVQSVVNSGTRFTVRLPATSVNPEDTCTS
jgi:PAS domain S-box-containing protein